MLFGQVSLRKIQAFFNITLRIDLPLNLELHAKFLVGIDHA